MRKRDWEKAFNRRRRAIVGGLAGAAIAAAGLAAGISAAAAEPAAPIIVDRLAPAATAAAAARALIERAHGRGQVRVIVGLDLSLAPEHALAPPQVRGQRARLRGSQQAVLDAAAVPAGSGVTLFDTIPFLALNADGAALERLLADRTVASIREDVPVPPTLVQSVPLIGADQLAASGYTGAGQVVAILDTGVEKGHPMLAGKVVSEACYSSNVAGTASSLCPGGASASTAVGSGVNCPMTVDGCGHGTHVASIAAGNAAALRGVAPGAGVIAIQVFSRFSGFDWCDYPGSCVLSYTSDQIRALERVYALRSTYSIAAANLSLGGGLYADACASDPLASVVTLLRDAKIATAVAAGNDGADGAVSTPACIPGAITVGSTTKADAISSFSNHSVLVDMLAPGSAITAAYPPSTYASLSGTSMATPHVAGAFALVRQFKPAATVAEIESALECSGPLISRNGISKPRIDVEAAVYNILRSPGVAFWAHLAGYVTGDVAIGQNADGRLEIFARGGDGGVWHRWQTVPNGGCDGWSEWTTLGGYITHDPAVGRLPDGRLVVFGRGGNGAVWLRWQAVPNGGWSGWATLGGSVTGEIAVGHHADGRLEVFGRGSDGAILHRWQTAVNGTWSGWSSLGGYITHGIAVGRNADGRLAVFARGGDGAVWSRAQMTATRWSSWVSLGGYTSGEIAVGQNADGRLILFARGGDGAVWSREQTGSSDAWSGWTSFGGYITGTMSVGRNADGRVEFFARGGDGSVWHRWQTAANGAWSDWASLGAYVTTDIAVAGAADGRLTAFARGGDNGVWYAWQTASGGTWY